jgi:hypothetical protein
VQRQSSSEEIRKQLQQEIDLHTALEDHIQLKMTNTMTLNVHKENPITIQHINWYHCFPCPDKFV